MSQILAKTPANVWRTHAYKPHRSWRTCPTAILVSASVSTPANIVRLVSTSGTFVLVNLRTLLCCKIVGVQFDIIVSLYVSHLILMLVDYCEFSCLLYKSNILKLVHYVQVVKHYNKAYINNKAILIQLITSSDILTCADSPI